MKLKQCTVNIGKSGIRENLIKLLESAFKNHENVRICVLKSGGHEKEKVKQYSEKILAKLGKNYTSKIVGFTIFIRNGENL